MRTFCFLKVILFWVLYKKMHLFWPRQRCSFMFSVRSFSVLVFASGYSEMIYRIWFLHTVRGRHRGSGGVFEGVAHCPRTLLKRLSLARESPVGLCAKSEDHVRAWGQPGASLHPSPNDGLISRRRHWSWLLEPTQASTPASGLS